MKKLFIMAQWAVVAALVAFAAWMLLRPEPRPDHDPSGWHSWAGFQALAWAGVTDEGGGRNVTPERLADQLRALRAAGYHTIAPEDALAFLERRAPLPEKAVLLLFEGGRKDSFLRATPALRATGFIGTLCVPTGVTGQWGAFHLKEDDLERIARLPHWRLCSMGHEALTSVPVDAKGTQGHFLTHRRWQDGRLEDFAAYRKRVEADYATAARILQKAGDAPVVAYAYGQADWSVAVEAGTSAAAVNRAALAVHHRLAFVREGEPFNVAGADPLSLTRLRVAPEWNGERLVQELATYQPRRAPVSLADPPEAWEFVGAAQLAAGRLDLAPGARAWVRGSDGWSDVDLRASLRLEAPEAVAAVYARYLGTESYLRAALTADGLRLQERSGERIHNLREVPVTVSDRRPHSLRLRVKANRLWAWFDDAPVSRALPVVSGHGRVGIGGQGAPVEVLALEARPVQADLVFTDRYTGLDRAQREAAGAVLPSWFESGTASPTEAQRRELLAAAADGVETIPVVALPAPVSPEAARVQAEAIVQALADPLAGRLVRRLALPESGAALTEELHARGLGVVHIAGPARAVALAEARRLQPNDLVLLEGAESELPGALDQMLRHLPPAAIVARVPRSTRLPAAVRRALRAEGAAAPAEVTS